MGRAIPVAERPSYEQLEEVIRRKDKLFKRSWNEMDAMRAILWMTSNAHEGNNPEYNAEEYAVTACIVARFINRRIRALDDEIECHHRNVLANVLAGQPESGIEEGDHA